MSDFFFKENHTNKLYSMFCCGILSEITYIHSIYAVSMLIFRTHSLIVSVESKTYRYDFISKITRKKIYEQEEKYCKSNVNVG